MTDFTVFLLIIVSLALGFLLGRRDRKRPGIRNQSESFSAEYFVGLNYLLNEQTDEAIESFIRVLEINSESVETFVVLGRLFRQRGEIDKAIQAHQDLLARPSLTREQNLNVQHELAQDYLKAGLFDRAETLLENIIKTDWPEWDGALNTLLGIYETEKEWQKAIDLVAGLRGSLSDRYAFRMSHYYCELAERAIQDSDFLTARKSLRQASHTHRSNVRVSLLQGQTELRSGNYKEAIRHLEQIAGQDYRFVPESLDQLHEAYAHMRSRRGLSAYLGRCLREAPTAAVVLASAQLVEEQQGQKEAGRFMAEQIVRRPSLKGLNALIDRHVTMTEGHARQNLLLLRDLTGRLEASKPVYQCGTCGFSGKELYWHCPKCQSWGSLTPIVGLEGE